MEVAGFSAVLVPNCQTAWHHLIPENHTVEKCVHKSMSFNLLMNHCRPAELDPLFLWHPQFVSWYPKRFCCMRFPYIFNFCRACCIPTSYLSPCRFNSHSYIGWRAQTMRLLIVQTFPVLPSLPLLFIQAFLLTTCTQTPSLYIQGVS